MTQVSGTFPAAYRLDYFYGPRAVAEPVNEGARGMQDNWKRVGETGERFRDRLAQMKAEVQQGDAVAWLAASIVKMQAETGATSAEPEPAKKAGKKAGGRGK